MKSNDITVDIEAAVLTSKKRKSLPSSSFVFPQDKRYPIHDRAHAANALARASGKPEYSKVRAAVCRRYPDLPACKRS
jgi:type IV secretory pathway VirB9-like protein